MNKQVTHNYIAEVRAIKRAIQVSRYYAARQVNGIVLGLYYSVGRYISLQTRNAKWGSGALKNISNQLQQELPGLRGFSEGNMRKMRLFYEAWQPLYEPHKSMEQAATNSNDIALFDFSLPSSKYSQKTDIQQDTIRSQVANELENDFVRSFLAVGFDNHSTIITKTHSLDEQIFYVTHCANEFWGRESLKNALRNDIFHKQGTMPNNFAHTLTNEKQLSVAMKTFKEDNVLDFLHIENPDFIDEHDVEQQIVDNVRKFMLSLGGEFAFIGNQYRLIVNGKERFIDLLFYHRKMRCLVAIELKGDDFEPEYAGKMNYYLSALDTLLKLPDENPSVGIILCRTKNNAEVEFALRDMSKPMGVATYHSREELPEHYRFLPTTDELKNLL